ncbi:hypothetical protein [Cephaloticoccus primus]|uniref:hypothetical protein n=1 Tax=Cephaloticoccus primus TaxID=1548207 RepID=UPI0012E75C59|nr:hypothetical protein [Cephaloticoccus primus]
MDWILDHLQLVIAVAAAFAYWLSARRQQQAENDQGPEQQPQAQLHDEESAARQRAEQARRIREEIQRKIAERQGRPVPLPSSQQARPQPRPAPAAPQYSAPARPDLYAALREQQQRIEAERRRLEEARQRAAQIRSGAGVGGRSGGARRRNPAGTRSAAAAAAAGTVGDIRVELRDRAALKRALVLREILGPPVASQGRA